MNAAAYSGVRSAAERRRAVEERDLADAEVVARRSAISFTVSPRRYSARSGASVIAGAASLTGIGAGTTGNWPVFGSLCGPLRNGRKSTVVEPSADGAPLTGFSGYGGLVVGETSGPSLGGAGCVPPTGDHRPHQLFSAESGLAASAVPSGAAL